MLYAVCGCPRSGTSLMMNLFVNALGEDRIIGRRHLHDLGFLTTDELLVKKYNESDDAYEARKYSLSPRVHDKNQNADKIQELNPNGFWEHWFTMGGIYHKYQYDNMLTKILNEKKSSVGKITGIGLSQSDPKYINKIIYVIRHPRAVAKSQEKLIATHTRWRQFLNQDTRITHDPSYFITSTLCAVQWLDRYKKPFLIVDFDDLIESPKTEIERIRKFLDKGDRDAKRWQSASDIINIKLRRSHPEEVPHSLWGEAEYIYEKFREKDFKAILEYLVDLNTYYKRKYDFWHCPRINDNVSPNHCELCIENKNFRGLLRRSAELRDIIWQDEPCIYKAGKDITRPAVSLEETVRENHWND